MSYEFTYTALETCTCGEHDKVYIDILNGRSTQNDTINHTHIHSVAFLSCVQCSYVPLLFINVCVASLAKKGYTSPFKEDDRDQQTCKMCPVL